MSDAPRSACPAYDALTRGLGTLGKAQSLQQRAEETKLELEHEAFDFDDESGIHISLHPTGAPLSIEPAAPPRDESRPSLEYKRLHEELSNLVSSDTARDILDAALRDLGVRRADAGTLDLREALVEFIPERLLPFAAPDRVEQIVWALERALIDIHRAKSPGSF